MNSQYGKKHSKQQVENEQNKKKWKEKSNTNVNMLNRDTKHPTTQQILKHTNRHFELAAAKRTHFMNVLMFFFFNSFFFVAIIWHNH